VLARPNYILLLIFSALALQGCGGGAGRGNVITPPADNVTEVKVYEGPAGTINVPFVSVTLCVPGTSTCQIVDDIIVDTGSTGLRVLASALPVGFGLTQTMDSAGNPLAECFQFGDGYVWGPVKAADVKMSREQASNFPVHIIADPAYPTVPTDPDCTGNGLLTQENSVQSLGGNGVLGIGTFREDCGAACANNVIAGTYYGCPAAGCQSVAVAVAQQVQNPVWKFAVDNNGVILQMPALDSVGSTAKAGSLVFGVGTQSNNQLGNATVFTVDPLTGFFTTTYKGQTLARSFVDSGSSALYFPDAAIPLCTSNAARDYYCPSPLQSLNATFQSAAGITRDVSFRIANADSLVTLNPTFTAFDDLGHISDLNFPSSFDWGLPFHYGRNVFVAIEGQSTSAGTGPYIAF
jgi:Protein of unknown function (DUF3443)